MEEENRLDQFLSQYKLPLGMGLVGTVLLISGISASGILPRTFVKADTPGIKSTQVPKGSLVTPANSGQIAVDVGGAVKTPGVYFLTADSRVEDALKAAGGVAETADPLFISRSLNLAQKVSDGMKLYIPQSGEQPAQAVLGVQTTVSGGSTTAQSGLVSLNNATPAELDKLPGIGAVTAQKIISGRPYQSIEDLITKKVVSSSVYSKIKDLVSVN